MNISLEQISVTMERTLTLANTPLDLQISICIFLHPSDILALRKTCKALELATRQRIVWVAALHRVCLDNTLFLPSFPIPEMSSLELEWAAMAPRRWIGMLQKQHSDDFNMPHPRATRIIEDVANSHYFIVPGGRYLVTAGRGLFVWDLGRVSTADCKLVASVGLADDFGFLDVQATQDGKGLVILTSYSFLRLSIFEIYPQSETPLLTEIAHLDLISSEEYPAQLLPDTLICYLLHQDRVVFRVVDFRSNYSTCFSADFDSNLHIKTYATKTTIMFFCYEELLIWAIPPLTPHQLDFRDFLNHNSTHLPPLLKIPFPDGILRDIPIAGWMAVNSWYFGSPASAYFDILYWDLILQRFKLIIEPDLNDGSLHFINESKFNFNSGDLFKLYRVCGYRICEDALVYFWNDSKTWGVYTGLRSAPFTFTNIITQWNGYIDSICPASGRYVYRTYDGDGNIGRSIVVVDLF